MQSLCNMNKDCTKKCTTKYFTIYSDQQLKWYPSTTKIIRSADFIAHVHVDLYSMERT